VTDSQPNSEPIHDPSAVTIPSPADDQSAQLLSAAGESPITDEPSPTLPNKVARKERDYFYKLLFEKNQMAIAIVDIAHDTIVEVNDSLCSLLRYRREDFFETKFSEFVADEESKTQFRSMFAKLADGETTQFSIENRFRTREGHILDSITNVDLLSFTENESNRAVLMIQDFTDRLQQESNAARLANYDSLTNLPNRRLFGSELERQLDFAKTEDQTLGVMFLDLDGFKEINDTLGHEAGDELLIQVASRLRKTLRKGDFIARLGGDEFAVINTNSSRFNTAETAQRLVEAIADPICVAGFPVTCSVSIGIASFPEDGEDGDKLLKLADFAMYEAKRNNKGFSCFRSEDSERIQTRFTLRKDLARAIELDSREIQLFFQPRINMETGTIMAVEALTRWNHPELGFVTPDEFFPIAEETTLIHSLGNLVLHRVCQQVRKWRDQDLNLPVAFNMSAKEMERPDILAQIEKTIKYYGVKGSWLEIEVTETASMKDISRSVAFMSRLKALGLQIAIDDFGTGYSSLTYLKKLPADAIKIDQSFIELLVEDVDFFSPDADIVRAIVTLAESFHMSTIAEGIETEKQYQFLRSLGCDFAQGYYFNPPMPVDELQKIIDSAG